MPVPADDIVCRFIRPKEWNRRDNRPKQSAFRGPGLSVWHQERLRQSGVPLENLRIEHLAGYGQAHHTAGDYADFASEAAQANDVPFQVQVEWRPDDEFVSAPWRQWQYAHVQVEAITGPAHFLLEFRRLLSLKMRCAIAPGE